MKKRMVLIFLMSMFAGYLWVGSSRVQADQPFSAQTNQIHEEFVYFLKDFEGHGEAGKFGDSISSAGDVNGDKYPDILIGAWKDTETGRAYLYYGGPELDDTADVIFSGQAAGDYFGWTVSTAGDVNNDGYDDVIIGAWKNDNEAGVDAGKVYLYYGGENMDAVADLELLGLHEGSAFGYSVAGIGHRNDDAYDDVIIGAPFANGGNYKNGLALVFYGGEPMDVFEDEAIGGDSFDQMGYAVKGVGDVDGNGFDDYMVLAIANDEGYDDYAQVVTKTRKIRLDPTSTLSEISGIGDINGDGYTDVAMTGNFDSYDLLIFYGSPAFDGTWDTGLYVSGSMAAAGDVNADGYDDIIVGKGWSNSASIYYGAEVIDGDADHQATGEFPGDYFGSAVSGAGDINGDGKDDVIVGAPQNDINGLDTGRVYLFGYR